MLLKRREKFLSRLRNEPLRNTVTRSRSKNQVYSSQTALSSGFKLTPCILEDAITINNTWIIAFTQILYRTTSQQVQPIDIILWKFIDLNNDKSLKKCNANKGVTPFSKRSYLAKASYLENCSNIWLFSTGHSSEHSSGSWSQLIPSLQLLKIKPET